MRNPLLPARQEMLRAFLSRDRSYEGVFFTGVKSTGVFCRVGCPARTPRAEQLEFFATSSDAVRAGFRACKRCRPEELLGTPPAWLANLLEAIDKQPEIRWTDADIRGLQLDPDRVRRWFQKHRGMTFHAFARARRLGVALSSIQKGESVLDAALEHGYDSLSGFNQAFREIFDSNPTTAQDSPVVHTAQIQTPLGPMIAGATNDALCLLEFHDRRMLNTQIKRVRHYLNCMYSPTGNPILRETAAQLAEYFSGTLSQFTVPLLTPGTPFQQTVWTALQQIPHGETRSYAEMARLVGRPEAVRAVARANGDNRIAIIIPCHRVIGSNGDLTGYGGGLWRKKRLLDIEQTAAD